jgi:hypothetical protein
MRRASWLICLVVLFGAFAAFADDAVPLVNWPVPGAGSSGTHKFQPRALSDTSNPLVFVPVTPCRVVDTRNANGPFGGPIFGTGQTRSYAVPSSSCTGIPFGISALSLNFSVTQTLQGGGGFLTAWQTGASQPNAATITWFAANQTLTAAAIVPTGSGGSISVFAGSQTHVIIDVNGYFIGNGASMNTGEQLSLFGSVDGSGLIRGQNQSTYSSLITSGVRGVVAGNADTISGVNGESIGSGANYGVSGINDSGSFNSAGVLGISVSRPVTTSGFSFYDTAIRGENGHGGNAILGLSTNTGNINAGSVVGNLYDTSGNFQAGGILGYLGSGSVIYGVFAAGDMGATGTKPFVEPHPTDASKVIRYVALEGPEAGTYFRGRGRFHNGQAVIDVPESFRIVSDDDGLTVQITPIGTAFTMTTVVSANLDQVVARGNHDVEFYYIVHGVRKAYKDWEVIADGTEFAPRSPNDSMPAYLSAEAKRRLIQNGTYNEDGSVNMATAAREGWTKVWAARENAQARAKVVQGDAKQK